MVLVFDYDGTIHDTKRLYGSAFRDAYDGLVKAGYAAERYYSDDYMARYLGMSPPDMWRAFMPELPEEIRRQASEQVRCGMISGIKQGRAALYPEIPDVLDELLDKGYRMVILSNCYHAYLEAHRDCFGLDKWFDGFYCSEDYGFRPKESIFQDIVARYPGESFMIIGDRASDFKVGEVHDIPVIGCAYGFGTEDELKLCDAAAADPAALTALINSLQTMPAEEQITSG